MHRKLRGARHFAQSRGVEPAKSKIHMSEALVIIGNGMAAARLVEELSKKALGRYAIAVIGDEPARPIIASCFPRCSRAT